MIEDLSTTIVLGFDSRGAALAAPITEALGGMGYRVSVLDGGSDAASDYPDVAERVCRHLLDDEESFHSGVLVCGTGLGMSIAGNKVPGIRAARCTDPYSVEKARRNSAANVLALGAELTTAEQAKQLVQAWVRFTFDSERSVPKIQRIAELDALRS